MVKTLLVFCDGTGMDGSLAAPNSGKPAKTNSKLVVEIPTNAISLSTAQLVGGGGNEAQSPTNVLRLSRAVKNHDRNGNPQIVLYQSGVGSESDFGGDQVAGTTLSQAFGFAVASKIRDAYIFLAQNYDEGDEICLFGFSRGAYTARKLSGLIDRIGLLSRQNLGYFFQIWGQLADKKTPTIPADTRHPTIKCVGVWDTVGSVFNQSDTLSIKDTSLPATVKVALHAVAIQENRRRFLPTLWTIPERGLKAGQTLKQVWFPGAHSDVGGGYERHELADISLYWMAGEIKALSLIELDYEFLRSYRQPDPDPWGTSQPHNAYKETDPALQLILGWETRLQSKQIDQFSGFHASVLASVQKSAQPIIPSPLSAMRGPLSLSSIPGPSPLSAIPGYMITLDDIRAKFGSGFAPQTLALNEFEQYCKDNWGKTRGAGPPPIFDSPLVVIRQE